jgi:hypothetical protein
MMIANQIIYSLLYNIAITVFIVILCFAFVGLVIVIEWLFTCVLDCFNMFSDLKQNKKEKRNGQFPGLD